MKVCSKCKEEKEFIEFGKNNSRKDGFHPYCKSCVKDYFQNNKERINENRKEYGKEYSKKNCEKIKEYQKEYRKNNIERIKKQTKEYRKNNKENSKEYQKEWRINNKEKSKEYREANKEKANKSSKEYRENNKEHIKEQKKNYQKERRSNDPLFKLSGNLRSRILMAFKAKKWHKNGTQKILGCTFEVAYSHIQNQFTKGMTWKNYGDWHIDHIIPLTSANTTQELITLCHFTNLQPLWAEDNLSKRDKIPNVQIKLTI